MLSACRWNRYGLVVATCLLVACTPERAPRPAAEQQRRLQRLGDANNALVERVSGRIEAFLGSENDQGRPPCLDILVLSGGADWGAFGAGFLNAWSSIPADDPRAMPTFEVVTGVSTGALIAPYAYLGEFRRVDDLYRGSSPDWSNRSILFGLFTGHGFYDISLLEDVIRSDLELHLRPRLQDTHGAARSLLVATTDLDLGMLRVWDLVDEARDGARLFTVQRAAIAVPAAFDPVLFEDDLHADAGVLMQFFVAPQPQQLRRMLETWTSAHPGRKPHVRYWLIINNRVHEPPTTVQPTWHATLSRSMAMMLKSGVLAPLRALWLQVAGLRMAGFDVDLRWIAIPADFPIDETRPMFDPLVTRALSDLGRDMALSSRPWRDDVPGYSWRTLEDGSGLPSVPLVVDPGPAR